MTRDELDLVLDRLVDDVPGHGDWSDVLTRAGVARVVQVDHEGTGSPRPRHRALLLAFALLAVLVALLATPAFGLREAILGVLGRTDVDFEQGKRAPSVIRYQFEDLDLGAPPSMAPRAIAAEARRVGTVRARGKTRTLWVAPTRKGGFCYFLEGAYGGCPRVSPQHHGIGLTYMSRVERGGAPKVLGVGGTIHDGRIVRLTLEFGDGSTRDLPFIYVSEPVDAGFFWYDASSDRQTEARGVRALIARDEDGRVVTIERGIHYDRPPMPPPVTGRDRSYRPQTLPKRPRVSPTPPLQEGEGHGVRVTAGANGSVLFDLRRISPDRGRVFGVGATYSCFRFVTRNGRRHRRHLGTSGAFASTVGTQFHGLGAPLDGCVVAATYGRRWPDRFSSHEAIEIPFSPEGRRFFADRAAAGNLALFVRSRKVKRIRRGAGEPLAAALETQYGGRIVRLRDAKQSPPPGEIGYAPTAAGVTFVTRSSTGRRFVVVIKNGKIVHDGVKPLAFVF